MGWHFLRRFHFVAVCLVLLVCITVSSAQDVITPPSSVITQETRAASTSSSSTETISPFATTKLPIGTTNPTIKQLISTGATTTVTSTYVPRTTIKPGTCGPNQCEQVSLDSGLVCTVQASLDSNLPDCYGQWSSLTNCSCNETSYTITSKGNTYFCVGGNVWDPDINQLGCKAPCVIDADPDAIAVSSDGTSDSTEILHNEFVTYSCPGGQNGTGTSQVACNDGKWDPHAIFYCSVINACDDPLTNICDPDNGICINNADSKYTCKCKDGYQSEGIHEVNCIPQTVTDMTTEIATTVSPSVDIFDNGVVVGTTSIGVVLGLIILVILILTFYNIYAKHWGKSEIVDLSKPHANKEVIPGCDGYDDTDDSLKYDLDDDPNQDDQPDSRFFANRGEH